MSYLLSKNDSVLSKFQNRNACITKTKVRFLKKDIHSSSSSFGEKDLTLDLAELAGDLDPDDPKGVPVLTEAAFKNGARVVERLLIDARRSDFLEADNMLVDPFSSSPVSLFLASPG